MPDLRSKNVRIIAALVLVLLILGLFLILRDSSRLITADQLDILAQKKLITRVVREDPYLYVRTSRMLYRVPVDAVDLKKLGREFPIEIRQKWNLINLGLILLLLMLVGLAVVIYYLSRRDRLESTLRQGSKETYTSAPSEEPLKPTRSKVRFDDVAGSEEVKEDLREIIDFLRHPARYKKFDIRLPKGVLLAGPPGVGKTLMAKAVAGEAKVPFFYQSGANIVEIYVGMGPRRVHELFQAAKKAAPAIIFIDEIDAVGRSRGSLRNEEREATLNQLLTEMDGFESDSGVVVLAATNRMEMLDPALLRPGRFDRRVHLSLPDQQDRRAILELYLKRKAHNVDLEALARSTVGFSAAALSTLVNEAALHALRRGKKVIDQEDFDAVRETVISGKRKILSFSDEERRIQAVYQSGKALVATWLDVPYERIGIVTTRMREADREIISRSEMLARIKVLLAGSAAVEMIFKEQYSNGAEDRALAISEVRRLVREFGSGERLVAGEEEAERLLTELYREVRLMLEKLEEVRKTIEAWLLEHENIGEEEARRILRDLF
ncbi:AAA family ATPase [Nitratifractor salsuginis]|uniref:Adenosinetriphosphatase n=1 Tax=Nitratifractor salsuginis (strain DSM 16511 / JCM 12458 / E9I37-1) TaxID=749222 RepID=E6WYV2_NITSE|nr:AAA family ATPase [Nitratifractor salsuginis]ADV46538.1 Adenosinetriphosphatase [Nitratifractor salsuginis DSM 16511]